MKKTITEWLGDLKLTEKKINKIYQELKGKDLFRVSFAKDKEIYKTQWDKEQEEIKALYQSLKQFILNRDKMRAAILAFNATNTIKVGETDYVIALALEKMKKSDFVDINRLLEEQIYKMNVQTDNYLQNAEDKRDTLQSELSKKANSSTKKDNAAIEEIMKSFVVDKNDYLELVSELSKRKERNIEFLEQVNVQLNLKNATTFLEIDV